MKKVAIVIVNWNGYKDTSVCLSSLAKLRRKNIDVETIVVDNGSVNDSAVVIARDFPGVTLLKLDVNRGFTGGNNVGITYAMKRGADFVWLLNNDTIVDPDALSILDAFTQDDVGIAGSKIYFAPGHEYHKTRYTGKERGRVFWYAGGLVDWANVYASHRGVDEVDQGQYDRAIETPFVTGCSMMIKRSVIDSVGLLDDAYYLYLEDLDYCLRAKRAGFRLMYQPTSVIWHVNAGSSGGAGNPIHDYYITRNRLLLGMRYASLRTKIALLREGLTFLRGSNAEKRKAVADFFFLRWGKQYEPKKAKT
jgi:GT2 family glycosyltransferase